MAENKPEISLAEISDSDLYSPVLASVAGLIPDREDPDTVREPKRRKNCPSALDKFEDLAPPNRAFSFSFDTKIAANSPESTPKFGSFNLGLVAPKPKPKPTPTPQGNNPLPKIPACVQEPEEEEEEVEEEIEVSPEQEGVGFLSLVDSVNGID